MSKLEISCDWCGKKIWRYPSQIKAHNFCSRKCLGEFSSKSKNAEGYKYRDFSKNSQRFAVMNKNRRGTHMDIKTKSKLRQARLGTGAGITYSKYLGVHEHRIVAERMLGRPLLPGEVVHHIDGDKRNNSPGNLMIFTSQKEHAAYHAAMKRGDAL